MIGQADIVIALSADEGLRLAAALRSVIRRAWDNGACPSDLAPALQLEADLLEGLIRRPE